jgi:hypothetical protein
VRTDRRESEVQASTTLGFLEVAERCHMSYVICHMSYVIVIDTIYKINHMPEKENTLYVEQKDQSAYM